MNSMKLVIPFRFYFMKKDSKRCCDTTTPESIRTKDESKRGTAFAFIFGVNWLWRCGVTAPFGVFFHEMKCNGMMNFMEFLLGTHWTNHPLLILSHTGSTHWKSHLRIPFGHRARPLQDQPAYRAVRWDEPVTRFSPCLQRRSSENKGCKRQRDNLRQADR